MNVHIDVQVLGHGYGDAYNHGHRRVEMQR
jgi:hypothetical protein